MRQPVNPPPLACLAMTDAERAALFMAQLLATTPLAGRPLFLHFLGTVAVHLDALPPADLCREASLFVCIRDALREARASWRDHYPAVPDDHPGDSEGGG